MKRALALGAAGVLCLGTAFWLQPPRPAAAAETARWLVRPAVLPFLWRDLDLAVASGDGAEAFARSQQLLELVPSWTDAQTVFAYRFATDGGLARASADADAAAAAADRLQVALAWLESARRSAGRREVELLEGMAMLPEIMARRFPGLEALLRKRTGLGAVALGDRYLAIAEQLTDSRILREKRFHTALERAASFLRWGDRQRAIEVIEWAVGRARTSLDRTKAEEWADLLRKVLRHLRGEHVNLDDVRADPRLNHLQPYLR